MTHHRLMVAITFFVLLLCVNFFAAAQPAPEDVIPGDHQLQELQELLAGKRVALLVNHTSVIKKTHLADTLKSLGVNVKKIFSPEHGLRGNSADGELVGDGIDPRTGFAVVSLYGSNKKPTAEQLAGIDVVVYDIQDVGARFYTYISTLHYMMEACASQKKKIIILDRPNPNDYVDGPVMEAKFKSFVGMHPIPVIYGLTSGELAQMINGEGWLGDGMKCAITVVRVKNYVHGTTWNLPVAPSPNLPTQHSILLYPSLCLFEGTVVSVGRGTAFPFEAIGNPLLTQYPEAFTPAVVPGVSVNPPFKGIMCRGLDLRAEQPEKKLSLRHLLEFYQAYPEKSKFFIPYFEKLAGTAELRGQIEKGMSEQQIRETWKPGLDAFKEKRKLYLLY